MRPKPQGGVLLDGSFEQVKILVCNLVVRFVLYIVFHQFYSTPISASFRPFDVSVEDERINFFAYLFCTSKNWRFVVQKFGPMMNAVPFWSLVSNKADDGAEGPTCEGIIKMDVSKMKDGDVQPLTSAEWQDSILQAPLWRL